MPKKNPEPLQEKASTLLNVNVPLAWLQKLSKALVTECKRPQAFDFTSFERSLLSKAVVGAPVPGASCDWGRKLEALLLEICKLQGADHAAPDNLDTAWKDDHATAVSFQNGLKKLWETIGILLLMQSKSPRLTSAQVVEAKANLTSIFYVQLWAVLQYRAAKHYS